jgi:multidrug efflux system membrane fusion protein
MCPLSRSRRIRAAIRHWVPALALLLSGCGENTSAPTKAAAGGGRGGGGGGAAPVIVGRAERKVVPLVIDAIGSVEPIRTSAIRAQITGTLFKIDIQEGQDVKAGDLLFEIDPRPFENALNTARAEQQKIAVQLETARGQVERYRVLSADAMVSKEQFQKIQDDARGLEAQSEAAKSAVANAALQLSYCSIRAPIDGRTGSLGVHEGDLIRANESGAPLVTINQLAPIYVTFGVPQQNLAAINRYRAEGALEVKVVLPGTDDSPESGQLTFVDNVVDSTTGTIKLKATCANDRHRLWPGQFANVVVTLSAPEVLTVPSSAVQTSQTGQHVYVVKEDKTAELRPVVIERTYENVAVVTKGLTDGETVVVDGQLRVIPGRPVEIKQPNAPADDSGKAKGKGKGKKS